MYDFIPLFLSLKLALITTVITIIITTPLAWWINFNQFHGKFILKTIISLPSVLPPTVFGFYLLLVIGKNGPLGFLDLAFSFNGLILASVIFNLPFIFQPIYNAFSLLDPQYFAEAVMLKASKWQILRFIVIPLCFKAYISAIVLGIGHTMGEFGLVLMIGGNIPGKTNLASIAIFDNLAQLNFQQAHLNSAVLLLTAFIIILVVFKIKDNNH